MYHLLLTKYYWEFGYLLPNTNPKIGSSYPTGDKSDLNLITEVAADFKHLLLVEIKFKI